MGAEGLSGLKLSPSTKNFVDTTNKFVDTRIYERKIVMTRRKLPRPTEGELAILRVLWRRGPSTVRAVHNELSHEQETGYTTVLKLIQIMTEKGLVTRDESQKTHVCTAVLKQDEAQRHFLGELMERLFNGSASQL